MSWHFKSNEIIIHTWSYNCNISLLVGHIKLISILHSYTERGIFLKLNSVEQTVFIVADRFRLEVTV